MKKRILITALLLSLSMTACGNKSDEPPAGSTDPADGPWAVNSVVEDKDVNDDSVEVEGGVYIDDEDRPTTTTEVTTYEPLVVPEFSFNTNEDENADKVENINTISIDGIMMTFPCSYDEVAKNFGLYQIYSNRYVQSEVEVDTETEARTIDLSAHPSSGYGNISFSFRPKEGDTAKLKDMECYKVFIDSSATNNEKLMKLSLPNGITFGSSLEDITSMYSAYKVGYTANDDESDWSYSIKLDDGTYVSFIGVEDKLNSVSISYP